MPPSVRAMSKSIAALEDADEFRDTTNINSTPRDSAAEGLSSSDAQFYSQEVKGRLYAANSPEERDRWVAAINLAMSAELAPDVTLNSDQVQSDFLRRSGLADDVLPIRLTDATDDGGLFGLRFN